jgi:hypothetical protein
VAKNYESGTREDVIRKMTTFAIRDQQMLAEALTPEFREPDAETAEAIIDAEKCIRDFKRFLKTMIGEEYRGA